MRALRTVAGLGLAGLLAACQTATVDPGASITVDGSYAALAECYAASQPGAVSTTNVGRNGFRTVTVTTSSPSRAGAVLTDASDAGLATGYNVAFTEGVNYKTTVTGSKVGPAVVPFFWRDVVIRKLRDCTGNPTLS